MTSPISGVMNRGKSGPKHRGPLMFMIPATYDGSCNDRMSTKCVTRGKIMDEVSNGQKYKLTPDAPMSKN